MTRREERRRSDRRKHNELEREQRVRDRKETERGRWKTRLMFFVMWVLFAFVGLGGVAFVTQTLMHAVNLHDNHNFVPRVHTPERH